MRSMDDYVREYISEKTGLDYEQIVSYRFVAEAGGAYSEFTEWDMTTQIRVLHPSGNETTLYLSEEETVEFLNRYRP